MNTALTRAERWGTDGGELLTCGLVWALVWIWISEGARAVAPSTVGRLRAAAQWAAIGLVVAFVTLRPAPNLFGPALLVFVAVALYQRRRAAPDSQASAPSGQARG